MTKPDHDVDEVSRAGTIEDSAPDLPFESPELGTRGFFPNSHEDDDNHA
ncbi:MAG: hypothetical protein V9G19_21510 [Tetrasphaera sp.]